MKPEWLKIRPPETEKFADIKQIVKEKNLHTVCQESHCPNMAECWSGGTATFMVLGGKCTRGCKFCAVETGWPAGVVDKEEPKNLAKAVSQMNLDYIVVTSVDRDDLLNGGASHFAECITELKKIGVMVEVLIPDFQGVEKDIKTIIDAKPDVIAHNVETVERLQSKVRDRRANYKQSLFVLETVKKYDPKIYTKTSLMLGLGEKEEEVLQTMLDIRAKGVDFITLGQYLRPSSWHVELTEYIAPEKFKFYEEEARKMGFLYVAAGPFVRSSYKAGELFIKNILTITK